MSARASTGTGVDRDWRVATDRALAGLDSIGATAGFVYIGDRLSAHAAEIVQHVVEQTGVRTWSGTAGLGVCTEQGEWMDSPAVVLMTLCLPAGSVREARTGDEVQRGHGARVSVVHVAPADAGPLADTPEFDGNYLVGGLTASRGPCVQVHSGGAVRDGTTALVFSGVDIRTGLSQGCTPLAPRRRVTRAVGNVIVQLDERPALDVLLEDSESVAGGDPRKLGGRVFAGVSLPNRDRDDYLVRNLVAVSLDGRTVAVAHPVGAGDSIVFMRRDPDAARIDMQRMLDDLERRAGGRVPFAGLYFSCVGRGPTLFGGGGVEVGMIRETLGDFPLVGFFGNGEVCHREVYGYTGVLALFYDSVQ